MLSATGIGAKSHQQEDRLPSDPVKVAVFSADPLSQAGLLAMLSTRDVTLLPPSRVVEAAVVVVVGARVSGTWLDEILPGGPGSVPVVLITDEPGSADPKWLADMGVRACVWRDEITEERLLDAVHTLRMAANFSAGLKTRLVRDVNRFHGRTLCNGAVQIALNGREIEVLRLLAEGLGTAEIAVRMKYSARTIKGILQGVTRRLSLSNRPHAVAYAIRAGVL